MLPIANLLGFKSVVSKLWLLNVQNIYSPFSKNELKIELGSISKTRCLIKMKIGETVIREDTAVVLSRLPGMHITHIPMRISGYSLLDPEDSLQKLYAQNILKMSFCRNPEKYWQVQGQVDEVTIEYIQKDQVLTRKIYCQ